MGRPERRVSLRLPLKGMRGILFASHVLIESFLSTKFRVPCGARSYKQVTTTCGPPKCFLLIGYEMPYSEWRAEGLQDSFGSASWLVQREGGNVMMDSPRFDAKLLARIKVPTWHRAFAK